MKDSGLLAALGRSVTVPVLWAVALLLGSAVVLWGLPDWIVRALVHVAAFWAPLVAIVVAGVLVYLHKYTTGVVMRWLMIPVAVSMALGFAGGRMISVGKHISLSPSAQFMADVPDWLSDKGSPIYLPESLPAVPEPTVVAPVEAPAIPVYEDASDTPHRLSSIPDKTAVSEPIVKDAIHSPLKLYTKSRKRVQRPAKYQTYWGF